MIWATFNLGTPTHMSVCDMNWKLLIIRLCSRHRIDGHFLARETTLERERISSEVKWTFHRKPGGNAENESGWCRSDRLIISNVRLLCQLSLLNCLWLCWKCLCSTWAAYKRTASHFFFSLIVWFFHSQRNRILTPELLFLCLCKE